MKRSWFQAFVLLCAFQVWAEMGDIGGCRYAERRHKQIADSVMTATRLGGCCDTTIAVCRRKKQCSLGRRFRNFICVLLQWGMKADEIADEISRREESLTSGRVYEIDTSLVEIAGDPYSDVTISAYISGDCTLCKKVVYGLYEEVTSGALEGRAKLAVKFLTAKPADFALLTAERNHRFWDLFKQIAEDRSKRLSTEDLQRLARRVGIDRSTFDRMQNNPTLRRLLAESRREAITNGVAVTPTLFINGRRYKSYKDVPMVVDAVEYVLERMERE